MATNDSTAARRGRQREDTPRSAGESRSPEAASIHEPVLLERCVALLSPPLRVEDAVYVDATIGMGGHAEAVLRANPSARLIGLDRDADAIAIARGRLAPFGERVTLVHAVYDELADVLDTLEVAEIDAALFDLGVSSLQLDRPERGFSYMHDAPLDMRMDAARGRTAADLVLELDAEALADLFRRYGDERLARRYAEAIVAERAHAPIRTTGRLVAVLQEATPAARRDAGHPAKRVFQALRIAVNDELGALERALPAAAASLAPGGRVVVEAYQSLEDRFAKRLFARLTTSDVPAGVPVPESRRRADYQLLTRGAERADDAEIARNPRARPVRLRAIERVATRSGDEEAR